MNPGKHSPEQFAVAEPWTPYSPAGQGAVQSGETKPLVKP
jgi:hypothetical protein